MTSQCTSLCDCLAKEYLTVPGGYSLTCQRVTLMSVTWSELTHKKEQTFYFACSNFAMNRNFHFSKFFQSFKLFKKFWSLIFRNVFRFEINTLCGRKKPEIKMAVPQIELYIRTKMFCSVWVFFLVWWLIKKRRTQRYICNASNYKVCLFLSSYEYYQ